MFLSASLSISIQTLHILPQDILIQSDRLVDLLLPIDATVKAPARSLPVSRNGRLALPPRGRPASPAGSKGGASGRGAARGAGAAQAGAVDVLSAMEDGLEEAVVGLREEQSRAAKGGKTAPVPSCDAAEAIAPVVSAGQAIAEFDAVAFSVECDPGAPLVAADPRVLQEAVSNVLDNALK